MLSIRKLVKAKVFLRYITFIIKMYYYKLVMKIIFEKWLYNFLGFIKTLLLLNW